MATLEVTEFIDRVRRSRLVEEDQLSAAMARTSEGSDRRSATDVNSLADRLVQQGLLSPWQVRCLLEGHPEQVRLGNYRLLRQLGAGAMSVVYLAEHELIHRRAAIKVLSQDAEFDASSIERFRREARAAAALDHPNIVRVDDVASQGSTHFIVMEYVDGLDLQTLVQDAGPLAFELAADYIAQIADALQHAHEAGLVHRDVKPGNCLVSSDGLVKVVDLGLAKLTEGGHSSLTVDNDERLLGTVDYLAPEQAVDSHAVDSRADIYSLGGTLYFLLTGHPPFPDGSLPERLIKHQQEMPKDIRVSRPDAPDALVALCLRMMAKDPGDRLQTALEVRRELLRWMASQGHTAAAVALELMERTEALRAEADGSPPTTAGQPAGRGQELQLAPLQEDESEASVADASRAGAAASLEPQDEEMARQQISQLEKELAPLDPSPTDALLSGGPVQVAGRLLPHQESHLGVWLAWGAGALLVLVLLFLFSLLG
jgi:serine/threonine-protein kinase